MPYKRFEHPSDSKRKDDAARGVRVLERLRARSAPIDRDEMLKLLAATDGHQINATLTAMFAMLGNEGGMQSGEAVQRHGEGKKSQWSAGPRCAQARHIAKMHHDAWWDKSKERGTITDVAPSEPGPKLVLRTRFGEGEIVEFDGGREALAEALDDDGLTDRAQRWMTPQETFIERIERSGHPREREVPQGYGEHGIWIRGKHDHEAAEVPEELLEQGGRTLYAYVQRGFTAERTIALIDAARQTDEVRRRSMGRLEVSAWWRRVENPNPQQHVCWISTGPYARPRWAPPFEMRARCWREVTIVGAANRARTTITVEGMRGEDARTARRAITQWRSEDAARSKVTVETEPMQTSEGQPRPTDPLAAA